MFALTVETAAGAVVTPTLSTSAERLARLGADGCVRAGAAGHNRSMRPIRATEFSPRTVTAQLPCRLCGPRRMAARS